MGVGVVPGAHAQDPWDPYAEGLQDTNKTLPAPVFVNADKAIPATTATYTPTASYLERVYAADVAKGAGTAPNRDFWLDAMLARDGVQPDEPGGINFSTNQPENIDYDNNVVLFTKGRALFMEDSTPGPGFRGDVAYIDSLGNRDAYSVDLRVNGTVVTVAEDQAKRHNTPSYWYSEFRGAGLLVKQTKFISQQNVAAEWLQISTTDGTTKTVELSASSSYAPTASGTAELVGTVTAPHSVTTVNTRLSGDGFTVSGTALKRTLNTSATSVDVKLQMGFTAAEIPESAQQYAAVKAATPAGAFASQTEAYNRWWVDNIPYIETPEGVIDKSVFYRWWLLRTNFLDAAIPGNDYQFPTSIEGIFGRAYDNAIVLTAGMFIDDMKYFRDPTSAYGTWLSAGEVARSQRYIDNPGNPVNWSSSYANFISAAAWRSYQQHGGNPSIAGKLAQYAAADAKGQLASFDTNDNGLIEYTNPAMTGNDLDAVSFSWQSSANWQSYAMDRPESAYVYAGASAAAAAYQLAGQSAKADDMRAVAEKVKKGVLDVLWEDKRSAPDEMGLKGNLLKAAYSVNTPSYPAGYQIPWKEINTYYPYTVGLMPKQGDADFDPKYLDALRLFVDQRQYSPFPFYTANQVDAADRHAKVTGREFFNNFSTINSTVIFRLLSSILRDYPNQYVTSDYYKKLLYWNAWSIYEKGDVTRQNENEFWSHGSPDGGGSIKYRSWIHQTQLGTTNFTMIEDIAGLRARTDDVLELSPIDIGWDHFTVNNLKYHGKDLTIVWDKPGDGVDHYAQAPEGYSAYIDGHLAFTVDALKPVTFNTQTCAVTSDAAVLSDTAQPLPAAQDVRFANDSRIVDLLAKAGVDVDSRTSGAENVAQGRPVTASYTSTGKTGAGNGYGAAGAVDGSTVNEPFWGTAGSPNNSDWLEIDLGAPRTVDEARVYFYRTSSSGTVSGYSPPSQYAVQYWNGTGWASVTGQARTPVMPAGNYNRVQFAPVTTSKVRLLVTHRGASRTGVKEVQVRDTGVTVTPAANQAPVVTVSRDTSYSQPGRARFNGTVQDDGLPSGTLSQTWEVTKAPTSDARVTFTNPNSASTTASFSATGTYELRFTASDGALSATSLQTVTISDDLTSGPDVSGSGTPSASYTASWNRITAVNDGRSDPGTDQAALWGTWSASRPASQWMAYTWTSPVRVSSAQAYFWTDSAQGSGAGVALPQSWKLEYLDQFGQWTPVSATSTYPTVAMTGTVPQRSRVTFKPVTTTQLRATFQASPNATHTAYSAVALSELDILGENPVDIEKVAVSTNEGHAASLPAQVTAIYADGQRQQVKAEWSAVDSSQYDVPGRFTVSGVVADSTFPIDATVSVGDFADEVGTVLDQTATTFVRRAPALPRTAVVTLTGGTGALESRPVRWAPVDPAAYAQPGTFEVTGAIDGTAVPARVSVTVEHDPDGDAPGAPAELVLDQAAAAATASWRPWQTTEGITITGQEVFLKSLTGGTPTRRALAAGESTTTFTSLPSGEYTVFVRTTSSNGASDVVSAPFAVVTTPGAPTVTLDPTTPTGDNGWYDTAPTLKAQVPAVNVAVAALPAASMTAGHNRLAGLNDGTVFYSGRYGALSDAESQTKIWGTWSPDRGPSHWVSYQWSAPKRLTSLAVNFWTDQPGGTGQGVALPTSWKAQYRSTDGTWADVKDPSPYTRSAAAPNIVAFTPVTTTALRLVLDADTDGSTYSAVGISEWQVLGNEASTVAEARINGGAWRPVGGGLDVAHEGELAIETRVRTASDLVSDVVTTQVKVDRTDPTPVFSGRIGTVYFGEDFTAPTCTSTDAPGGSGPAGCTVSGLNRTVGTHTLVAEARDNAGRRGRLTQEYTVLPWTLKGFYQPVDMGGVVNTAKNGVTVPLRFEAFVGDVEITDTTKVSMTVTTAACDPDGTSDAVESLVSGPTSLRYDTTAGQFIFTWKTPRTANTCYSVSATTVDGSSITARFRLT